jgi:HEAT repeat protein
MTFAMIWLLWAARVIIKLGSANEEMQREINLIVRDLIELLSSSDDLARTGVCKSLIAIGGPAVSLLVDALKNSNHLVRWEAA